MTLKQATLTLSIALVLALSATLVSLSQVLPAPLAYFIIALVAAGLTLVLTRSRPDAAAGRIHGTSRPASEAGSRTTGQTAGKKEKGQVKWFSASKGFGFITRDSGDDIFVHFRSINSKGNRVLREGQRVEFNVGTGSKGLQAEDVTTLQ